MYLIETYMKCINCDSELKHGTKYCCHECQNEYQYKSRIKNWLSGKHNGMRGKTATVVWIKRYLIEQRGEKCELCGWAEINSHTGNVPIELSHKDGNFKNNKIENLELVCPNCHSLTDSYRSLNNGNGRPRK